MDLGVVADVDGELGMEVEKFDGRRVLVSEGEGAEFAGEGAGNGGSGDVGFDDESGALTAGLAEADEGAAGHPRVGAEDLFARLGVEGAVGGFDAFGLAAHEPQATIGREVTAVAHAVPRGRSGPKLRVEC